MGSIKITVFYKRHAAFKLNRAFNTIKLINIAVFEDLEL